MEVVRRASIQTMPAATIEVRRPYSTVQEVALITAVHDAMREALRIPAHDRTVRLIVHEPHRFAVSPALADPDAFTLVSIDMFAGRTIETKRALYRAIVAALAGFTIPADHIKILLRELPRENWGIRGGQAACDVELGFAIDI
jgi:phenylpyruvate tautomerase PptA (4-oxalocrotonate tautomerase family)